MSVYQKFLIRETDSFDAMAFPQLEGCLEKIVTELNGQRSEPMADMIISMVKDQTMFPGLESEHSSLTSTIESKGITLDVMKDLFASSKNNPAFRQDMEVYIREYLVSTPL